MQTIYYLVFFYLSEKELRPFNKRGPSRDGSMIKNILLLGLLTWVTISFAKQPVVHESIAEAESFKVEKPVEEQEAQRSLAGSKIKKQKKFQDDAQNVVPTSESDSEVRYWQYSE